MAKTLDKPPESKKEPPKPTPKPAAPAPAVAAPTKTVTPTPSNGVAAAAAKDKPKDKPGKPEPLPKRGSIARPTDVIDLQGSPQFMPGAWADYIKSFRGDVADVDVKWGTLAPKSTLPIQWDKDVKLYSTRDYRAQPIPIVQPFFAGLPEKLAPSLFIKVHKDQISGFAAPHAVKHATALANVLDDPKITAGLGLVGFKLPSPKFQNEIKDGHFLFGTDSLAFTIGGWVKGSLKLHLIDTAVEVTATAHVAARGIAEGDLTITRDKEGHYSGELNLAVALGKASGTVLAKYVDGDISITGTIKYTSDKFSGSLTVMFGNVNEVQQAARGQLDPGKLLADEKVPDDEKAEKGKKGEKGLGAWGELQFSFTDWLTGSALAILDPFGHITVVGKIAPPKEVLLMKEHVKQIVIPPFPIEITARYGLPYVADVHVGVGFELGATGRIGPAVLTDIVIQGTYSTDPKVKQDFSLSGAFRISAYAGLNLSVYGFAGLTLLKHHIDFIAKLTGSAGIKAYAEARPTIGYREKEDPVAGKKGEAYLQGHLEAAAQPVLGLGGELSIRLSSPWWSPAPNKTWKWPLFDLEWPLATSLGIGADIDYVIGSGKMPDFKLGKVDFDASKFMDSALDKQIPPKAGGADKEKAGSWKSKEPPPMTAPPSEPAKGPEPAGGTPTKGTPSGKAGKGGQTPGEAVNVPKDPAVAKRWSEGLEALANLHDHAEKDPETSEEIRTHLGNIKRTYGFTRLEPERIDDYWLVAPAMNPETPKERALRIKGSFADKDVEPLHPHEGEVKEFSQLTSTPDDDMTGHHMPQDNFMAKKATELGLSYDRNDGIAFNMYHPFPKRGRENGRHKRTRTYGRAAKLDETPAQALTRDIADVKAIYAADQARLAPKAAPIFSDKIEAGLKRVRELNEQKFADFFEKG